MNYETLYNLIRSILKDIYGVDIPKTLPQSGKTYGDLSPNGTSCDWSNRKIEPYIPKEWEKKIGTGEDPVNV